MSKYTTEVRFICETEAGLSESVGSNDVETVIANSRAKIFNFNYPIFDENYRSVLETKILKHFYTREIGEETVGLWKLRLNTKLNEIMPYYNKLYESELIEFNPLYTYSLDKTGSRDIDESIQDKGSAIGKTVSSDDGRVTSSTDNVNKYADTPQGALTNVENGTYLTNATIDNSEGKSNSHNEGKVESNNNTTFDRTRGNQEDYFENVKGYSGVSGSTLLKEFRETFLNKDLMIINDLEPLFFGLW